MQLNPEREVFLKALERGLDILQKTDTNMGGICLQVRLFIKKGSSSSLVSDPFLTVKVFVIYILSKCDVAGTRGQHTSFV